MKLFGIELKPGMIIVTKDTNNNNCINYYIVFPTKNYNNSNNNNDLAVISYYSASWDHLDSFIRYNQKYIIEIYESVDCSLYDGKLLWKRKETKVLTKKEIAEKFNIDLNDYNIEIKD